MAILSVLKFPHKILAAQAEELSEISSEDRRLIRDMIDTMYAENGVGLAANQVGVLKQIFVASPEQIKGEELVYINPRIVKKKGKIKEFEGCLSVPEFYEPVQRAKKVWMIARTPDWEEVEVEASGLLSRIFQHETDHLNGTLFIDRLGYFKSRLIKKKIIKKSSSKKR